MEFRAQKAACALAAAVWLAPAALAADLTYEVRHDHLHKGGAGTLTVGAAGLRFVEHEAEPRKHPHAWTWAYQDIQQLEVAPRRITVLTYRDNRWRLGADRQYRFELAAGGDFSAAYSMLEDRLDQRFVAALADCAAAPEWRIPVKRLRRFGGSGGELLVADDRIVYQGARPGESRTWRLADIDNIASSGPFDLTITTYERARTQYGSRKGFRFQLKEPLAEDRYNELWRAVNRAKGLPFLNSFTERKNP